MGRKKLKFWNVPVTEYLDMLVERAVEENAHVSKADFIRDAVREKLEKLGFREAIYLERKNAENP